MPESVKDIDLFNPEDLTACRKNYPANLFLQRERPVISEDVLYSKPRVIYSDDLRTAPYEGKLPAVPDTVETPVPIL
jgi:hypothetical protein